jgi:Na+-driven multidrug efflux pump
MLMNVINVVGNAFCIFVLKWGVYGVAVPTFVSRAAAGLYMVWKVTRPQQTLWLTKQGISRLDGPMMGSILRIGIPSACENCFFSLGRLIVASMITLFGTSQVSANAVAGNIDRLGIIVGQAMGLAMVTVVGQCVGARDTEQASYYIKKLLRWTYIVQGITNGLIVIFVGQLVDFYSTLAPETRELAMKLSTMHASLAILFWPVSFVLPNALRASNDVKFTMWVGIFSMLVCRIFGSWLLCVQMELGAVGVWIAMISDWVCRTSFFVPRIISGKWKSKYKPT